LAKVDDRATEKRKKKKEKKNRSMKAVAFSLMVLRPSDVRRMDVSGVRSDYPIPSVVS
jgi:hypothetical protein